MREVSRHEIKYLISLRDAELLKHRLPALLRPDEHAEADGGYFIRSVYFDNAAFGAYNDKLSGVKERTKYRLRYYNFDPKTIFLEKKSKNGDLTGKDSARIPKGEAVAFLKGDRRLPALPGLEGELGRLRQADFRPVCLVDYDRFAFTYPVEDVRVTIDMDVRTAPYRTDFFDPRVLTVPVLDEGEAILEVKYNAYLPAPVRALLDGVTMQRSAVSKYTRCLGIIE